MEGLEGRRAIKWRLGSMDKFDCKAEIRWEKEEFTI